MSLVSFIHGCAIRLEIHNSLSQVMFQDERKCGFEIRKSQHNSFMRGFKY